MDIPVITLDAIALNRVAEEVQRARNLHVPMRTAHEAYAVILEELDEFWNEVKKRREYRNHDEMAKELTQIAAMALRAQVDLGLTHLPDTDEQAADAAGETQCSSST